MRVLIISHMYPSCVTPVGGIFVQKQAEAFVDAGVEVVLVNPVPWVPPFLDWHPRWRLFRQVPRREQHHGMTVHYPRFVELPKGLLFSSVAGRFYMGIASLVRRIIKEWRPDVIQAHAAYPDGVAAVRFGNEYGIPVVVTVHGLDLYYTLNFSLACEHSVKYALSGADRVVLVSEALQKNYGIEQWIDLDKLSVIYNGMSFSDIVTDEQDRDLGAEQKEGRYDRDNDGDEGCCDRDNHGDEGHCDRNNYGSDDAPVLLTVGFLIERKGHAYVLRALPELLGRFPRLTYRIVGDGEERARLERLAETLGVRSHVVFLGDLCHRDAMGEMAGCDVMVLPSWDEGFGVVYLEAMAHAKPVIGIQGEGAALLIESEKVGITVPAHDSQAIACAAGEILGDRELARGMGRRGRDVVLTQFTWEHNAERTIRLYKGLITR